MNQSSTHLRPLIRPTLFAGARLALFLAIFAWGVGHFRPWTESIDTASPHTLRAIVNANGTCVRFADDRFQNVAMMISSASESLDYDPVGLFPELEHPIAIKVSRDESYIASRHWLNVLAGLMMNLIVHLTYRKRDTNDPVDDVAVSF